MESIIGKLPEKQAESAVIEGSKKLKIKVLDESMTESELKNVLGPVFEVRKELERELI
jgi:hypothetical protein